MSRRAEREAKLAAFRRALEADWRGLPYGPRWGRCSECEQGAFVNGRGLRSLRCLDCHSTTDAARRRARRRTRA